MGLPVVMRGVGILVSTLCVRFCACFTRRVKDTAVGFKRFYGGRKARAPIVMGTRSLRGGRNVYMRPLPQGRLIRTLRVLGTGPGVGVSLIRV